jgi:hypothetical protein
MAASSLRCARLSQPRQNLLATVAAVWRPSRCLRIARPLALQPRKPTGELRQDTGKVQLGFHGGIVARVPRNCSLTGAATMGAALHRGPIALRPKCLVSTPNSVRHDLLCD